jgi:hypothetical protein
VSGGFFDSVGNNVVHHVAVWSEAGWQAVGDGLPGGSIFCLASQLDRDAAPVLYAGGAFRTQGAQPAFNIAQWNGQSWSPLGGGVAGGAGFPWVYALTTYDDGSGPALYAGGSFTSAGSVEAKKVARWDGQSWSALGGGLGSEAFSGVYALARFDDGTRPLLIAGGDFTRIDGAPTDFLAGWDGTTWTSLGGGVGGGALPLVFALAQFDDVFGSALYVAGTFTTAGGVPAANIARWDGAHWSPLESGVNGFVVDMVVFDDGTGPALYVAGVISSAGGLATPGIARWDGIAWSAVGSGIDGVVRSLAIYDDGWGSSLFAAVQFNIDGGGVQSRVLKWTGRTWSTIGTGFNSVIDALLPFDDGLGAGPALIVGGSFTTSPAFDSVLARWQGCPPEFCSGDLDGNGSIDAADLAALLGAWSTPAADLDGDGVTGASDLATLLGGWGSCQ